MFNWQIFCYATTSPSLFVLGAGASMPTIKNDPSVIREKILGNGIYDVNIHNSTLIRDRLLPYDDKADIEAFKNQTISTNELAAHIPTSAIELIYARQLAAREAIICDQYEVFLKFRRSVLFIFNYDNLADQISFHHVCLYPHGKFDGKVLYSDSVERALSYLAVGDSFVERSFRYHPPIPEHPGITNRLAYRHLKTCYESLKFVVFIGYSFGKNKNNDLMDDIESFEMIVDLLKWRPKPVLIIDPSPEYLSARLESCLNGAPVYILRCKWNVLASFILSGAFYLALVNCEKQGNTKELTKLYLMYESQEIL